MKFYRVANWSKDYENNRSREIKNAEWVPVPNGFDGDGYISLVHGPDGPLAYAGWICILLVASRCEVRGDLIQTTGKPHTPASIAAKCRLPVGCISIAIERTLANEWLLSVDEAGVVRSNIPQAAAVGIVTPPHPPAETCGSFREKGREENRTEIPPPLAGGREAAGPTAIDRIQAMIGRDLSSSDRLTITRAEDKYGHMGTLEIHGQQVSYIDLFDRAVGVAIAEPHFEWRSAGAFTRYIAAIVQRAVDDRLWPGERSEPVGVGVGTPAMPPVSRAEQEAVERAWAKQQAREAKR